MTAEQIAQFAAAYKGPIVLLVMLAITVLGLVVNAYERKSKNTTAGLVYWMGVAITCIPLGLFIWTHW